jgi:hypothetical protein
LLASTADIIGVHIAMDIMAMDIMATAAIATTAIGLTPMGIGTTATGPTPMDPPAAILAESTAGTGTESRLNEERRSSRS